MQHKIREQVMDITISSRLDAFRAQHLAAPFYYRQLLPALEKIFDELSTELETISIDRLELDLGFIPMRALEATQPDNEWQTLLRNQVSRALQQQVRQTNLLKSSTSSGICRHWLFYMEHGYLEWNMAGFDEKALADVLETLATDYGQVLQLRKLIQKSQQARLRIVREHDEKFLVSLVEILTAITQRDLAEAVSELSKLLYAVRTNSFTFVNVSKQITQEIWVQVLLIAAEKIISIETISFIETILSKEEDIPAKSTELQKLIGHFKVIAPVWQKVQEKMPKGIQASAQSGPEKEAAQEITITQTNEIDSDGIFVSFAGLAILHPFLATFFKRSELLSGNSFRNTQCTEKAVHLLYYLATGKTNAAEHELIIPKLLCALPIHYALKEFIELTPEEKQEAGDMVQAAIDKWEKLKNVSVDAMRENFITRPGKLYTKNDSLYLQVESNSLDVLLDYLPWTLSIIKLPWMKELLRIEWR